MYAPEHLILISGAEYLIDFGDRFRAVCHGRNSLYSSGFEGDTAVKRYEEKFDKVTLSGLQVSEEEIKEARELVSEDLKQAIRTAKANIEKFHASQRFTGQKVETTSGVTCWQKAVAIEKVGLYIPGGTDI